MLFVSPLLYWRLVTVESQHFGFLSIDLHRRFLMPYLAFKEHALELHRTDGDKAYVVDVKKSCNPVVFV